MIKLEVVHDYFWEEIYEYDKELNDYYIMLFNEGIDRDVFLNISFEINKLVRRIIYYKEVLKKLDNHIDYNFFAGEIVSSVIGMCMKSSSYEEQVKLFLKKEIILRIEGLTDIYNRHLYLEHVCRNGFSDFSFKEFILNNSSLLHLVYSNNTHPIIRKYSEDSYMFLCQFHRENTPSFGVTSYKNLCHCFGCGYGANAIDYIMSYENLSYREAISLLAQIYMIDIDNNCYSDQEVVSRYQSVLLSDNFKDLVNSGIARINRRGNGTLSSFYALEFYDVLNKIIDRVRNSEHIKYKKSSSEMVLKLKNPFDE